MKQGKRWLKVASLFFLVFLLSACSSNAAAGSQAGFWDSYIIFPLSQFILWLSSLFGNSYAMGIIVLTILVRSLLIPLNNMQTRSQRKLQEIQPELDAIKSKYPNKDRASMEMLREEQAALMEKRGVNQYAGCLPILIQLPVMIILYQTILKTQALREGHFLWTNLGQADPYFILPILAAGLAYLGTYLTMKGNPSNNSYMKGMMYFTPVMIFIITFGIASAIGIYFVVSNLFTVIQTLIFNNPYKIIAEREAKLQAEKDRRRALKKQLKRATKR